MRPTPDKHITQNVRSELDKLEQLLFQLKTEYEQFFTGILPLAPERLHATVKRKIRELQKAPLRSNAINFRLKSLEGRYNTFNSYWQRVLKQREEGTYHRDLFKAAVRERFAVEDAWNETAAGKAEKGVQALFKSYRTALEQQTGRKQEIDFQAFEKSLIQKAKQFKEKGQKVSFRVVMEDGKVRIKARAKTSAGEEAD
ncbi:MAG: hypothetical protein J5J00_09590 [Deltaproteobacteria bacterium]|nr:hypothetical protein [Deltaproteobacteria bacterium]